MEEITPQLATQQDNSCYYQQEDANVSSVQTAVSSLREQHASTCKEDLVNNEKQPQEGEKEQEANRSGENTLPPTDNDGGDPACLEEGEHEEGEQGEEEPHATSSTSRKKKKKAKPLPPAPRGKLRSSKDVLNRLLWDEEYSLDDYVVGYEDRFAGVMEMPLASWSRELTEEEFIPMHRIVYFREKGGEERVVWDRINRIDLLFGKNK